MAKEQLAKKEYSQASNPTPANDNSFSQTPKAANDNLPTRGTSGDMLGIPDVPRQKKPVSRAARRARAAERKPELLRSTESQARGRRRARARNILPRLLPQNELTRTIERARATVAAASIGWPLVAIITANWLFIFIMWFIGVLALSTEGTIFKSILPGEEVFLLSYAINSAIWIILVTVAAVSFTFAQVDCFGGWKRLIFIACLAAQLTIFINLFPWMLIWVFWVILFPVPKDIQDDSVETDTP